MRAGGVDFGIVQNISPLINRHHLREQVGASAAGTYLVVGAPFDNGDNEGAIHFFAVNTDTSTYVEVSVLASAWATLNGYFGTAVAGAAASNLFLVGAPNEDGPVVMSDEGVVYLYNASGTVTNAETTAQLTLLQIIGGEADDDEFGTAVSLSADGQTAAVGAPGKSPNAVFFYEYDDKYDLSLVARVDQPSGGEDSDLFGSTVGVSGGRLLVGAPYHDTPLNQAGAAFLYVGDGLSVCAACLPRGGGVWVGVWVGMSVHFFFF